MNLAYLIYKLIVGSCLVIVKFSESSSSTHYSSMVEVPRLGAQATVIQRQDMYVVQERGRDSLARERRMLWYSREEFKSAEG